MRRANDKKKKERWKLWVILYVISGVVRRNWSYIEHGLGKFFTCGEIQLNHLRIWFGFCLTVCVYFAENLCVFKLRFLIFPSLFEFLITGDDDSSLFSNHESIKITFTWKFGQKHSNNCEKRDRHHFLKRGDLHLERVYIQTNIWWCTFLIESGKCRHSIQQWLT